MTPEEAVNELVAERLLKWRAPLAFARKLFETVQVTAKTDETRRCEKVARMQEGECARQYRNEMFAESTHVPTGKHLCDMIADEILRTGGLEVGE